METLSRRADAQAISATERWNENWEAEQHWTNEMRVASAKARWLHEELANVLIAKDQEIHDLQQRQLAELKAAQEPRLLTYEDFKENADDFGEMPAWCEFKTLKHLSKWTLASSEQLNHKNRRYWTSRPTDEQREAIPWTRY